MLFKMVFKTWNGSLLMHTRELSDAYSPEYVALKMEWILIRIKNLVSDLELVEAVLVNDVSCDE